MIDRIKRARPTVDAVKSPGRSAPHKASPWALALVTALIMPAAAHATQYAFLVGVSKYASNELRELRYAESDIRDLYYALRRAGYGADQIVVLSPLAGAQNPRFVPFHKNIVTEFDLLIGTLRQQDSLLVALAGHGVQYKDEKDSYFCPGDADLGDRKTLISLQGLYDDLQKRCAAGSKVLLVDACRNDPLTELARSRERVQLESVTRPQQLDVPGGVAALFSCSVGQRAYEHPELNHGIFFHHVIEALKGPADLNRDGILSLGELNEYVVPQVQTFARVKLGAAQTPELRGEIRGILQLARVVEPVITNSIGIKLAYIPPGEFLMGSPETEASRGDDEYQHLVRITRPFYLGVYEVTQAEYQRVMGSNPSWFAKEGEGKEDVTGLDTSRFPVENVSWEDAVEFCRKLGEMPEERAAGRVYRLPTEAEWEYGCRAGTATTFHFGNQLNGRQANCDGNYPYGTDEKGPYLKRTTAVGSYSANGFGLHDMHGNVWEWCQDWYGPEEYRRFVSQVAVDPTGPAQGVDRVVRGGGWYDFGLYCRPADRYGYEPGRGSSGTGFRLALGRSGP